MIQEVPFPIPNISVSKSVSNIISFNQISNGSYNFKTNSVNDCSYTSAINEYGSRNVLVGQQHFTFSEDLYSQFNPVLSKSKNSGLLQPGVKMIGQNYLIFEKPPTYKNIFFVSKIRDEIDEDVIYKDTSVYRLPIPWQLYFVTFNPAMYTVSVRMFFMKSSLFSLDSKIYLPPLPNFYINSLLCRPGIDSMEEIEKYSKDHSGVISCAYDWVWDSGSNMDLTEACTNYWGQIKKEDGIFKNMSSEEYSLFYGRTGYSATVNQMTNFFKYWEKYTLSEVSSMPWPNFYDPKIKLPNASAFLSSELLENYDFLFDYLSSSGDGDEDAIAEAIENQDYDLQDYFHWLIANKHIPRVHHTCTYDKIIPALIEMCVKDFGSKTHTFNSTVNNIISLLVT